MKIVSKEFHKKIGVVVAVKNNTFNWSTSQNLPLDEYILEIGNKKLEVVMGNGDWFDFDIKLNNTKITFNLKSNRKSDQVYNKTESSFGIDFGSALENQNLNNNPEKFYELALSDWDDKKKLDHYADAENNGLSEDYKAYRKQLMAVQYLNEINNYRRMTSWSDPKFAPPKLFLNELNENILKPTPLLSKMMIICNINWIRCLQMMINVLIRTVFYLLKSICFLKEKLKISYYQNIY